MKYSTILAFAAGAMAAEYYDPAYDVVSSSSSTPVKAIVPSTSSAADYYDYPVTGSSSSVKSSSTPYKATKPVTSSSSAAEYYDYPVSSSSSSKKPTYTTKWIVTAYPSPCPYESTFVSASKTYTKTYTSTSTITTSSCITYYPSSSSIKSSSTPVKAIVPSTSSADYYDYPVSSSTPVAPVKPSSTPVAPVKASTPAAPVYPVIYGTATSAYNYAATGTGAYAKPAQFTGAATKNGAGIALAGAAIVAALF